MNFWDYAIWSALVQFGAICMFIIFANILRRKIPFLRRSLLPTAVIAGFMALIFRSIGWLDFISIGFLDGITFHALALGFIALSLKRRYTEKNDQLHKKNRMSEGLNSGATIVGTYLVQGIVGLTVTILFAWTILSWLFPGSGLLLAIAFGQGPGQANNFGRIYEELGFSGGQSFALSLASIGFLVGSIVTVIYINILRKKGKISVEEIQKRSKESMDDEHADEMPLSEPVDRMTMNIAVIMFIFMISAGFLFGFDRLFIASGLFGDFGVETLRPMMFGFNFIFAMLFAFGYKRIFVALRKRNIIKYEYTSNLLLGRIGGSLFDFMIIAGILLIDINVVGQLIVPIIILMIVGSVATFIYLKIVTKYNFHGYQNEQFVGFFAHLTGQISTGIAMIRVVDPNFKTRASDNLVLGSGFAILLGFPMMFMMGLAPSHPLLTLGILVLLFIGINLILFRSIIFKRKKRKDEKNISIANEVEELPVVDN
ncbi:MAG: hypothetical protein FWE16_03095 [Firmicutes bacterium]|nr:hypothetical protein [Bacillota bacterium]